MEVVTTRTRIRGVAAAWAVQYPLGQKMSRSDSGETLAKLKGLDVETATADDVANIIGNDSWCRIQCDECEACVSAAVIIGAPLDYESRTATVCANCIHVAASGVDNPP